MNDRLRLLLGCSAGAFLTFLAGRYLGELGIIFYLLCPVPILYLVIQNGIKQGGVALLVSGALILTMSPISITVQYILVFGLSSLTLGHSLRRHRWDRSVATATILVFAIIILLGVVMSSMRGTDLISVIRSYVASEVSLAQEQYAVMDLEEDQLTQLKDAGLLIAEWGPKIFPGVLALGIGLLNYLAFLLVRKLPKTAGEYGVAFFDWKAHEYLVWLVIGAGFSLVAPEGIWSVIAVNILIVLVPVYFLQGLAVMAVFLSRRHIPPLIRGIIYCMLLLNPLPMLVATLGLFDMWADFRRPRITKT